MNKKTMSLRNKIVKIKKQIENLEQTSKALLTRLQQTCNHEKIAQVGGRNTILGYNRPRRICLICCYEEESWNWPGHDYFNARRNSEGEVDECLPTKLNCQFVKQIDSMDAFWKLRHIEDNVI